MTRRIVVHQRVGLMPWRPMGIVRPRDQLGTMADFMSGNRQIVLFGWRDGVPGVWLSMAGLDIETGTERVVHSVGWEPLADLRDGAHERPMVTAGDLRIRMRWTLRG